MPGSIPIPQVSAPEQSSNGFSHASATEDLQGPKAVNPVYDKPTSFLLSHAALVSNPTAPFRRDFAFFAIPRSQEFTRLRVVESQMNPVHPVNCSGRD